jgi:hypothetical protein
MLARGAERGGTAPNYSNDATGLAYLKDGQIMLRKAGMKAKDFIEGVEEKDWQTVVASPIGLMHNRARSKGTINPASNHPVSAFGWVAVHNGTISNDDDVFAYFKDERPADVDSIAIPLLLSKGKDMMNSIEQLSVLSGGVTTAFWSTGQLDTIGIGRWGPNELYMWYDNARRIMYWSSAYLSGIYMEQHRMGSLRFQNITRLPEERVALLTPERVRTFTLKRHSFLMPMPELSAYRNTVRPGPSKPASSTTDGSGTLPGANTSGGTPPPGHGTTTPPILRRETLPKNGTTTETKRWRWVPAADADISKPPPVAENVGAHFLSLVDTITELEKKTAPAFTAVHTAYGTWHFSTAINNTSGAVVKMKWFKPAKRVKEYYQAQLGGVPLLPAYEHEPAHGQLAQRYALEKFTLITGSGVDHQPYTYHHGFMCPTCGITQTAATWKYWNNQCKWCNVPHRKDGM